MKSHSSFYYAAVFFTLLFSHFSLASNDQKLSLSDDILDLQQRWAKIQYLTPEKEKENAFEALSKRAEQVKQHFPSKAEPIVWHAIILSTYAGAKGGLGALGLAKESRKLLLKAEQIDASVLHGSIYTSLGSLYYKVPGWPIGFGDDDKAEVYLKKALSYNPNGIDPNYFMGDYLISERKYNEAKNYLIKALNAPARPDRPLADKGRKEEIRKLLNRMP